MESSSLVRIKEGSWISGVCTGLSYADKGNTIAWRLAFSIGGLFFLFPVAIYFVMAIVIPLKKGDGTDPVDSIAIRETSKVAAGSNDSMQSLETKLQRIEEMRSNSLISDEEAQKLRSKALDLD
ncbi:MULTISPECIES: PspC domain-containing protein [Synechococcaceae]|uniref:PspC domain-containing protein n=1 Tax=Synechococcaceae TaxID=1890426 RepID=UPI0011A417C3|nr:MULTISPECIES: PspC domain-containing protein [Synechococcaceae]MCT4364793.1 PspC domain-containing protein [Candidatus Regnicoccus frigidus MAG-AL1]MCT4367710.1 PspC domain-containing protein [Candidatus Regnicoccus frigidus MAG-AL2]